MIQAGDGQQAVPGGGVAIRPAVLVTDASGKPVAGVTVVFTVDSGGGSVTGATVTTGDDGIATVGSWTLGSTEGRNVLRATAGSLPPVRFAATAVIVGQSFPEVTLGTSGGTVGVTDPGPLSGFRIAVPANAYPGSSSWTISYATNTTIVRKVGINPITPLIRIASSVGDYTRHPLTLTVPATVPAGQVPFIALRDPATGAVELLATHVVSPNLVTAVTGHLNGANLVAVTGNAAPKPGIPNLAGRAPPSGYEIQVFVTAITPAELDLDVDTQFRPGIDDWDAVSLSTLPSPRGDCSGLVISSMWYYWKHRRNAGAPALHSRFNLGPGVKYANVVGNRWASLIQQQIEANDFGTLNEFIKTFTGDPTDRDSEFYQVLKANLLVTRLPQFMAVSGSPDDADGHAILAWKTTGGTIFVADPNFPGNQTTTIRFASGAFSTYIAPAFGDSTVNSYPDIFSIGLSQLIPLAYLDSQWPSVVDSSIAKALFPGSQPRNQFGLLADTLWASDTLRLWVECPSCSVGFTSVNVPEAKALLDAVVLYYYDGTTWTGNTSSVSSLRIPTSALPVGVSTRALAIFGRISASGNQTGWKGWWPYRLVKLGATLTPDPLTPFLGQSYDMQVQLTGPQPTRLVYRWDFGDGTPKVSVAGSAVASHTYDRIGTFRDSVEVLNAATEEVIARAVGTATVAKDAGWVIQSATLVSSSLPPGGIGSLPTDTTFYQYVSQWIAELQATPTTGGIFVTTEPTGGPGCLMAAGILRLTGGVWPVALGPDNIFGIVGSCGDPHYTGSLTLGTLGTGALVGSAAATPLGGTIGYPGGSIDGTMAGKTLTGTFVVGFRFSTGIATYTVQFRANQVKP